jgi:ankyrin repeat protein
MSFTKTWICNRTKVLTALLVVLVTVAGCALTDNPPETLHMAAFKGNMKAAKGFISNGTSVNAKGPDGERPLHFAVNGDRIDMVEYLLDNGANVNGPSGSESTPLHGAAWKGHLAISRLLITRGADVNAVNQMGKTPLDWATKQGNTEVAKLIRNHEGALGNKDPNTIID